MKQHLQEISEQQKHRGINFLRKKWDAEVLDFMQPIANEMVDLLKPKGAEIIPDAVSCRMGFMFFPDMLLAAK